MKRRLISLLALSSILISQASCAGTGTQQDDTSGGTSDTTSEVTTDDGRIKDDLPAKDFEGKEFPILTTSWYNARNYIYADTQDGDVMNDALYDSISTVEGRFGVDITITDDEEQDAVAKTLHNLVMSGDDTYKLYYGHDLNTVQNALNGDFLDIKSLPNINFDKPWWRGTSDNFTIGGKLYFTGNCLSLRGIFMNYVLAVNKKLADNYSVEIPYDKVTAGEWYIDDLSALIKDFPNDLDGDGKMTESDMYGLVTSYFGHIGLQSDLGGTMVTKDANGNLQVVDNTSHIVGVLEKVEELMSHGSDKFGASNEFGQIVFVENKSLFMFGEMRTLYTQVRPKDIVYGILPFPKYDSNQKEYRSAGCDIYWGIPKTASDDADMIGTVVEALCCKNYNDVVPKIWELVLGRKLADSEEDTAMFEIIRGAQFVDLGFAFSGQSDKLNDLVFMTKNTKSDKVASYVEKRREAVVTKIDELNSLFAELD